MHTLTDAFVPLMARKYEATAFLFVMQIAIRSLFGVFDACTAFHLSCMAVAGVKPSE